MTPVVGRRFVKPEMKTSLAGPARDVLGARALAIRSLVALYSFTPCFHCFVYFPPVHGVRPIKYDRKRRPEYNPPGGAAAVFHSGVPRQEDMEVGPLFCYTVNVRFTKNGSSDDVRRQRCQGVFLWQKPGRG